MAKVKKKSASKRVEPASKAARKPVAAVKTKPKTLSVKAKVAPPKVVAAKAKVKVKVKVIEKTNGTEKPVIKASPPKPPSAHMLAIRSRLMSMLNDVRKDIDHEVGGARERDLAHINDTSDMASDAAEGDLALRIAESETAEASEIERAIEKIDNGTYGTCETCNKPIGTERIEYLPYVTLCIKCQELSEIRKRDTGDELDDLAEGTDSDNDN